MGGTADLSQMDLGSRGPGHRYVFNPRHISQILGTWTSAQCNDVLPVLRGSELIRCGHSGCQGILMLTKV